MTDLNNPTDLRDLYGDLYPFSENKRGDVIRFRDPEMGELSGTILWVVGPGPIAATDMPAHYIVDTREDWPSTVFFNDVIGTVDNSKDDPTLQKCPYCQGMHEIGKIEQCPFNPNNRK